MVIESFFCVSMVDHHKIGRENETYLNHQMGYDTPSLASKSPCYAKNSPNNSTSQMVPTQKRPHYHKVHKVHKVHKLLQDQAHMGLHNFPIFLFFLHQTIAHENSKTYLVGKPNSVFLCVFPSTVI